VRITDVRAHVLRSPLAQPFAFSQGWVASRGATIVEVTTDEGVTGWGEALCQGLQPPEIVLLLLSLGVSIVTFALERTNVLQGAIHLLLFLAYLMLIFD